jgi:hypothetical protein
LGDGDFADIPLQRNFNEALIKITLGNPIFKYFNSVN